LQNCLKAACRVKSLNSTKIQRHGNDGNLVQTSLSENRIQCEETETLNSHAVLDCNQDVDASARAVGCSEGSTMRPKPDNQVCAPQPGKQCAVIDTESVQCHLQASTPQSAIPTRCQFGVENGCVSKPFLEGDSAPMKHHRRAQMTAEVYQGFPLFESVDVNSSFIVPNGN